MVSSLGVVVVVSAVVLAAADVATGREAPWPESGSSRQQQQQGEELR